MYLSGLSIGCDSACMWPCGFVCVCVCISLSVREKGRSSLLIALVNLVIQFLKCDVVPLVGRDTQKVHFNVVIMGYDMNTCVW